jgi:hypothetical protein
VHGIHFLDRGTSVGFGVNAATASSVGIAAEVLASRTMRMPSGAIAVPTAPTPITPATVIKRRREIPVPAILLFCINMSHQLPMFVAFIRRKLLFSSPGVWHPSRCKPDETPGPGITKTSQYRNSHHAVAIRRDYP